MSASLEKATEHGVIENTSDGYQFCHDKFQSFFRSMVETSTELQIHKRAGKTLLKRDDSKSRYHAAVHLNRATVLLFDEGFDRAELARINLEASKYCKSVSYFFEATQLLKKALYYLPEAEKWQKHYALTLEISTLLATMTLSVGEMSDCQRISQGILDNARTSDDKLDTITVY